MAKGKLDMSMDFDLNIGHTGVVSKIDSGEMSNLKAREKRKDKIKKMKFAKFHMRKAKHFLDIAGIPEENQQIRAITQGSFNMFSILLSIIESKGVLEEVYLTTFNMNEKIILALFELVEDNKILKLRIMISDSVRHRVPKRIAQLKSLVDKYSDRDIILKLNWNHSKVMLIRSNSLFYVLEGSGNLSDNAQIEQYCITNSKSLYVWHREWMDEQFERNVKKREEIYGS